MKPADSLPPDALAPSLFSSPEWFDLLRRTAFASGTEFMELGTSDSASLPLVRIGPERLHALSTYYTPLFAPVQTTGTTGIGTRAANDWAQQIAANGCISLNLEPLADDAEWAQALQAALRKNGYHTERFFRFGNWFHRLESDQDFTGYFAARPSALRNTVKRASRRLARQAGFAIKIHTAPSPELEAAIADYTQIYNASWKHPEPWPDFIPGLCRLAAAKGWLRLGLAHVDNVPAAAQIWLVSGGVASIYKLAYAEQFKAQSIGSVLTTHLMEHVIDIDRVAEIDYLVGDEPYKRDWMSARRTRWGLAAYSKRSLRGRMLALRSLAGRMLRRIRRLPDDPYMSNPAE